jgi:DNA-binding response OmpR family regulator
VLVIEDEERLARSIARALEDSGMSVDIANDGDTGLWRAREMTYDAITLDRMLPGTSGEAVCRTLRSEGCTAPILMLTALTADGDEMDGFDAGADDYLRKPFSPGVLVARLHALARRGPVGPSVLRVEDLELDPRRIACSRGGVDIALTVREFAVLEALVRRSPAVVSKRELLDLVWGFEFEGDPAIVEVYISYLRRKIDRTAEQPLIHTVRGAGYRVGT